MKLLFHIIKLCHLAVLLKKYRSILISGHLKYFHEVELYFLCVVFLISGWTLKLNLFWDPKLYHPITAIWSSLTIILCFDFLLKYSLKFGKKCVFSRFQNDFVFFFGAILVAHTWLITFIYHFTTKYYYLSIFEQNFMWEVIFTANFNDIYLQQLYYFHN